MRKRASHRHPGSAIQSVPQSGSNRHARVRQGRLFSQETYELARLVSQIQKSDESDLEAAYRALEKLDACAQALEQRARERASEEQERRTVPEHLSFDEGLKWITGQDWRERARTMFARVWNWFFSEQQEIEQILAEHADRMQVPTPRDDEEREAFRLAASTGQYGRFHRQDLWLNKRFFDYAQDLNNRVRGKLRSGKVAHRENSA